MASRTRFLTVPWQQLTQEERGTAISRLEGLEVSASHDLPGLKKLLARDYDISSTIDDLRRSIQRQGQERLRQRVEEERAAKKKEGTTTLEETISVPRQISSAADLDALIAKLNELRAQLGLYEEIKVSLVMGKEE